LNWVIGGYIFCAGLAENLLEGETSDRFTLVRRAEVGSIRFAGNAGIE
jgi:hypothetical protein